MACLGFDSNTNYCVQQIRTAYGPVQSVQEGTGEIISFDEINEGLKEPSEKNANVVLAGESSANVTSTGHLLRRDQESSKTDKWYLSMISMPRGYPFDTDFEFEDFNYAAHLPSVEQYSHTSHPSNGNGQTVYVVNQGWLGADQNVRNSRRSN